MVLQRGAPVLSVLFCLAKKEPKKASPAKALVARTHPGMNFFLPSLVNVSPRPAGGDARTVFAHETFKATAHGHHRTEIHPQRRGRTLFKDLFL